MNRIKAIIDKNNSLTKFKKKVYKTILSIPKGEVRTYKWVASRIQKPGSQRAVGNALNKNPYSPYVPCHRIIRADGSLGGYAGGAHKKRMLLRKEGIEL